MKNSVYAAHTTLVPRLAAVLACFALLCLVVLSTFGCGSKDTGTMVKYDPVKSKQADQRSIEAVKNNPKISEAEKQRIMARMGGSQSGAR